MSDIERWTICVQRDGTQSRPECAHRDSQFIGVVRESDYEALIDRIAALEKALARAVFIVEGGRNPDSARNVAAREWRELLREGSSRP